MLNTAILPRPWSGHYPRVPGHEPPIRCEVRRVSHSKRHGWRAVVTVGGCQMATSHHPTRDAAEAHAAGMMAAYTEAHYVSK